MIVQIGADSLTFRTKGDGVNYRRSGGTHSGRAGRAPPAEYAEEAAYAAAVLRSASIPVRHVLELGSGGGHNAVHLKAHFTLTLVDISPEMLEMSRRLNPECDHHQGAVHVVHETHRLGLFGRDVWLRLVAEAGFDAIAVTEETTEDRTPRELFIGHRPSR